MADKEKARTAAKIASDSPLAASLKNLVESIVLELPSTAIKSASGDAKEGELEKAGWKAYDAAIALFNSATNALYTNESFGGVATRILDAAARANRLQTAMAGAFFASLWPAVGLPTADDVESLHEQIRGLRGDLAQSRSESEPTEHAMSERLSLIREAITSGPVKQVTVWSGWPSPELTERDDIGN
jgi:hypothetical protein